MLANLNSRIRHSTLVATTVLASLATIASPHPADGGAGGFAPGQTWDLSADWSDTANPNGPWSYNAGSAPISTHQSSWANGQPGWALATIGQRNHIPAWFKATSSYAQTSGQDLSSGTVFCHSNDPASGTGVDLANVTWTSPGTGRASLDFATWFSAQGVHNGRSNSWRLYHGTTLLANGVVGHNDSYDSGNPAQFQADVQLVAGDVVRIEVERASNYGTFQAFRFRISAEAWDADAAAPTSLSATYDGSARVILNWNDSSSDEDGFQIERRPGTLSFALLAATGADATSHIDSLLYPSTNYTYRVRAFGPYGVSTWSNEASITTSAGIAIPAVPRSPTYLEAAPGQGPAIDLAWIDNSVDETFFDLEHAVDGGAFETAVRVSPDVEGFVDQPVHPGWPYVYRVRALALQGPSPWSNTAGATLPATLDVAVVSGSLTDSPKPKRDKLKISATCAPAAIAPSGAAFDPVTNGLELRLGFADAPVAVSIAAGDAAWKVKSKRGAPATATWKSPSGASPKVAVVVDLARHVVTASVSGADFAAAPTALVRTLVASGVEGGRHEATWTERKPGAWRPE